jgi:hypothetical protein
MSFTHEQAAQRLGMANREVVDVEEIEAGHVVTTHDGQRVLVTDEAVLAYTAAVASPAEPEGAAVVASEEDVAALHARLQAAGGDGQGGVEGQALVVPQGTTEQVMEWVGEDPAKASLALATEQAASSPRTGLIGRLEKLVTQ